MKKYKVAITVHLEQALPGIIYEADTEEDAKVLAIAKSRMIVAELTENDPDISWQGATVDSITEVIE